MRMQTHADSEVLILLSLLSGYEGVPQFFSSLLCHIESVLDKQISTGPRDTDSPESKQATVGSSADVTGP